MRTWAALAVIAAAASAAPRDLPFVADAATAVERAKTRGKLILLTVLVDDDPANRAVVESVFRDRAFRRIADEFVLLYANPDYDHGRVSRRGPDGKKVERCADCPTITCDDHNVLAHEYARSFYTTVESRTPVHFVIDRDERLVEAIFEGSMETGLDTVPAGRLVNRLEAILDEHGRGLSEKQYERMQEDLVDARAARARGKVRKELDKLKDVAELDRDVVGVREARARMDELDAQAAEKLAELEQRAESTDDLDEVIEALRDLAREYRGLPTAEQAATLRRTLLKR